ncbi:serine hydrolase domain-containing protein [Alteromonas sp. 14N.309.X.WAT.G.H12]|uniref:serine hydrolase domain-containing protein n=1 Tax=Alteromonas sp. 14N.309.X.WAT.G.H12 TaxID=3120824 RepID=UPI002FD2ACD9
MSTLSLDNWQLNRKLGLRQLHRILPDLISVNARNTKKLVPAYDNTLAKEPHLLGLCEKDDIAAIVVIQGSNIVFEHYGKGFSASCVHSAQSSTKPVSTLLLEKAISAGKIAIDDHVEKYIPEIGPGFYGCSVKDIMSMNVLHEFNEMTAYTAPMGSRLEQLRIADESSFGYLPVQGSFPISRRDFAQSLQPSPHHSSNENTENTMVYATINTEVSGWILERAMNKPLAMQVRELMHDIGGEGTVYMSTDHQGVPSIGAGLILTARDFARYGMLLRDCNYLPTVRKEATTKIPESTNLYGLSLTVLKTGYSHSGWGGQYVFVCPETDVVAVVFGGISGLDPMPKSYFDDIESAAASVVAYYDQNKKEKGAKS